MYNDHPEWEGTEWLWDPTLTSFNAYRNLLGLSTGIGQHYLVDLDGNIRWGYIGTIGAKENLTDIIDELI